MEFTFGGRIRNAWNAFRNQNPYPNYGDNGSYGGSYYRPDRVKISTRNERSIITSIFNKMALDVANIDIRHCKLDDNDRFLDYVDSKLDNCIRLEANIDQTGKAFIQDAVMSMFDEGHVAIVPVDTIGDPLNTKSYEICTMRTGRVTAWYPSSVRVELYNERKGIREEITLPKYMVAIVENPLYAVMNEPNSTLQRLIRKLNLLDTIDEQSGSGKLDLIIQLPYIVKSPARKAQAEERRKDIENQLKGSKYGIAYTDGTEKITQLNRPVENNLLKQVEYLTSMLYSQLGITEGVLDGTAEEGVMSNYYSRTIEPIISAIVDEMIRKFLTKTARSQKQTIMYFRDPFKLVPTEKMADIADKFTRNEILTSNEIRAVVGRKPSDDPRADMLINSNLNHGSYLPGPGGVKPTDENQVNEGIGNVPVKDLIVKGGNQFED
jgi:hypothetical protein